MRKTLYGLMTLAAMALTFASCTKNKLDNLDAIPNEQKSISGDGVVTEGITKDNETVKIPFKIMLDGPATKAFQVALSLNADTVNRLIADSTLKNTILMPSGGVDFPNVINVAYGASSATGVATVRLTTLERNWGKNVAFAFRLTAPGKGNTINGAKSNILVVVDTKELIKEDEIHYLTLLGGGGILDVDYQKNYTITPAGITIPITLNLAGEPASAFNVKIGLNKDTVANLIQDGTIPANSIMLDSAQFTIDTALRVNSNVSTATIRLQIGWPIFDANIQANKRFVFVVYIKDANKHVIHATKSKIIVLVQPEVNFDNNSYITGNGTGLKAEYFSNNQLLDFDGRLPDLVRIEPTIDWPNDGTWQNAIPSISHDNFSTRWTGEFLAPVRGNYRFWQNEWDDGARLIINGVSIVDDFTTQWDKESRNGYIFLERGKRYKIEANHRENVGGQRARLTYEVPGLIDGKRIVPQSQLYPAP